MSGEEAVLRRFDPKPSEWLTHGSVVTSPCPPTSPRPRNGSVRDMTLLDGASSVMPCTNGDALISMGMLEGDAAH